MPKIASGFLCFGPSFFASAAFILSIFANARCYLVSLDENNSLRDEIRPEPENFGLWCYESVSGGWWDIRDYRDFGSKVDAARGFGTTVLALGLVIWIFYLVASCVAFGARTFMIIGFFCHLNCLFQGLVFLVFKSDQVCSGEDLGCGLSVGGNCGIAAAVCWFFAGVFSCGVGAQIANKAQGGEPEYQAEGGQTPGGDEEENK